MTQNNFDIQKENLQTQTNDGLDTLEQSMQNFKNQQEIVINDAFYKIRKNVSSLENSNAYEDLYNYSDEIQKMSNNTFSNYLEDMADLMSKAAKYAS